MNSKISINRFALLLLFIVSTNIFAESSWLAKPIGILDGFKSPACVTVDTTDGSVYISNIYTEKPDYWCDDGLGFISKLDKHGKLILKWAEPTPTCTLNAPKGLCIFNGFLYINDNQRLLRCPLEQPKLLTEVKLSIQPSRLNSLTSDGETLWMIDSKTNNIIRLLQNGRTQVLTFSFTPPDLTALAFTNNKMYGVSWKRHDLYELHPLYKTANLVTTTAFNLENYFINLISLVVLNDHNLLVADFWGNKVSLINYKNSKTVTTLFVLETPTGLAFEPANDLLYVTQLQKNRVVIYSLKQLVK